MNHRGIGINTLTKAEVIRVKKYLESFVVVSEELKLLGFNKADYVNYVRELRKRFILQRGYKKIPVEYTWRSLRTIVGLRPFSMLREIRVS